MLSRGSRWLAVIALLGGCSSGRTASAPLPEAPPTAQPAPSVVSVAPPLVAPEPESLPSYFTLELTSAGQLFADGTPVVDDADLARRARVAAGEISRAAVFGDARTQELRLVALFELLLRAGFTHVRFGTRPAPKIAAAAPAGNTLAATAPPALPSARPTTPAPLASVASAPAAAPPPPTSRPTTMAAGALAPPPVAAVAPLAQPFKTSAPAVSAPTPLAPRPTSAPAPVAAQPPPVTTPPLPPRIAPAPPPPPPRQKAVPVTLQTVGMKVSGYEVDEATRQRMVQLIERQFDRFRGCYPLAENRDVNSSFGVDLYVPKDGGAARIQQTRSRLEGKDFTRCMERAFLGVRFKAPAQGIPQVVSYSVLFKID
ncbi:MAG: hypothetical protein ABW217_02650 [Polyangiaceae bacterium]